MSLRYIVYIGNLNFQHVLFHDEPLNWRFIRHFTSITKMLADSRLGDITWDDMLARGWIANLQN